MAILLVVVGAAVALYCAWQLRRWFLESEAKYAAAPRRLEAIADELVATAEATSSALAEKTESLTGTIGRAEKVLARLQSAVTEAEAASLGATAQRPAAPAAPLAVFPAPAPEPERQPGRPAGAARTGAARLRAPHGPVLTGPAPEPGPQPEPQVDLPELHRKVYRLADAGQEITAIARQLGLTKGEVQLILGLRRMS